MPKFPKNKGYKSPLKDRPYAGASVKAGEANTRHYKFAHVDSKAANPHKDTVTKASSAAEAKKAVKAAVEKDAATSYAPFKMKGHTLPGINQRTEETNSSAFQLVDDIKNPVAGASAMKIHDGKKFEDAGFMDTHFPSGKARTPAKKRHDKIKQDEKDKKTIEEDKIVRRMKQLEKKLKLDPNDKAAKDELLKLSTTTRGQEYTDTGK